MSADPGRSSTEAVHDSAGTGPHRPAGRTSRRRRGRSGAAGRTPERIRTRVSRPAVAAAEGASSDHSPNDYGGRAEAKDTKGSEERDKDRELARALFPTNGFEPVCQGPMPGVELSRDIGIPGFAQKSDRARQQQNGQHEIHPWSAEAEGHEGQEQSDCRHSAMDRRPGIGY